MSSKFNLMIVSSFLKFFARVFFNLKDLSFYKKAPNRPTLAKLFHFAFCVTRGTSKTAENIELSSIFSELAARTFRKNLC